MWLDLIHLVAIENIDLVACICVSYIGFENTKYGRGPRGLNDKKSRELSKVAEVRTPLEKSFRGLILSNKGKISIYDAWYPPINRLVDHISTIIADMDIRDGGPRILKIPMNITKNSEFDVRTASTYAVVRFLTSVAPLMIKETEEEGFGIALAFVDASQEEPEVVALGIGANKCLYECDRILVRSIIAIYIPKLPEKSDDRRKLLRDIAMKVSSHLDRETVTSFLTSLGYLGYSISRVPIAIYILRTAERGEGEGVEVVIREGMESFVVKLPTRNPEWSLSMFPEKLVSDLETIVVKPIKLGYSFAPKGIILMGPPGVGKSVLAEAIAQSLGKKVIDLKPSIYRSMWYGMTEKILDKILRSIVKRTDIALVIDDAEFLVSRTMAVHEVHVSEISLILSFLQKPVRPLTILTSNSPTLIDPAILRPGRIDVAVVMGYPDREARKIIIENLLKKYGAQVSEDLKESLVTATRWMSNAEIDALIRMALSKGDGKITAETIEWARRRFRIDYNVRASEHQFMRWSTSHMPGLVITYIPQDHEI
jgi:hypothetical protein